MSGSTEHIDNPEEALNKSMEAYRQQLLKEGNFKEGSREFDSLMALHKYFEVTPKDELEKIWKEIEDSGVGSDSPTVEEYFQGINPQFQYEKGYREGAKRLLDLLKVKFADESNTPMQFKPNENGVIELVKADKFSREQIIKTMQEVFDNN
jgi:hypothetical protein